MNVMYFKHTIKQRVIDDIALYSVVMPETYDMIELLYQAVRDRFEDAKHLGFTARDYFAENFCMNNPFTGKCIQWLYHRANTAFADQWYWYIDTQSIVNMIMNEEDDEEDDEEEPNIDHEEDC